VVKEVEEVTMVEEEIAADEVDEEEAGEEVDLHERIVFCLEHVERT